MREDEHLRYLVVVDDEPVVEFDDLDVAELEADERHERAPAAEVVIEMLTYRLESVLPLQRYPGRSGGRS